MILYPKIRNYFSTWQQEFQEIGWELHKLMRKLKFVKSRLKYWNKDTFGNLRGWKLTIISNVEGFDLLKQDESSSQHLLL